MKAVRYVVSVQHDQMMMLMLKMWGRMMMMMMTLMMCMLMVLMVSLAQGEGFVSAASSLYMPPR